MRASTLLAAAVAVLLPGLSAASGGLYANMSPVLRVTAKTYSKLIEKSPYTSMIEFYAPWCGHCQNLKPAYEKVAESLHGIANVAAVNCDDDDNAAFCGQMGVQGFPTLKLVRPSKMPGQKPIVEDYHGERSAKAIAYAVTSAINNHVTKITDQDVDKFLSTEGPKAILFSEKKSTSVTIRSIAIDFLDVISVAQVRNTETGTCAKFGIDKFPSLVLLSEGDTEPILYEGEMNKKAMVEFLSQAGAPISVAAKAEKENKAGKNTQDSPAKVEPTTPSASGQAKAGIAPIPMAIEPSELSKACLEVRSHTCILAFVPSPPGEKGAEMLKNLAEVYDKQKRSNAKIFQAFVVPHGNTAGDSVRERLHLPSDVELLAIHGRRGWWKHFPGSEFDRESIEVWIDQIRMGEGEKYRVPPGVILPPFDEGDVAGSKKVDGGEESEEGTSHGGAEAEMQSSKEESPGKTPTEEPESEDDNEKVKPIEHDEL